jgi:glyoxylase-like metal-dependent hydrolase (beta-lactamase superfamily II)
MKVDKLDLGFLGREGLIGAFLLRGEESAALVETGPTSTLENLMAGLRAYGVAPESVGQVFLTHIHLDHAGASGNLAELLPNAVFYVHEVGAPHMIDPSRLLRSAGRIYGDQMDTLWGETRPVPEDRLVLLEGGETVEAAGGEVAAYYTPGHAYHHLAYFEPGSGALFTGDVAGVRMSGMTYVRPPIVPPEFDPDAWKRSIDTMRQIAPASLWLTHGGGFTDAARHLDELEVRMENWIEFVELRLRDGMGDEEILAELRDYGDAELRELGADDETLQNYDFASSYWITLLGLKRHFTKRSGEG